MGADVGNLPPPLTKGRVGVGLKWVGSATYQPPPSLPLEKGEGQ